MIAHQIRALAVVIGAATLLGCSADSSSRTAVTVASSVDSTAPPTTPAPPTIPVTTVPVATVPPEPGAGCAATGPSAAIDRDIQLAWLCLDGYITTEFPVSTAWSMPDPGVYQVYAKDLRTTSTFGGHITTLRNFVAFSYGERTGARVAFHAIPMLSDGSLVQPAESVGDLSRRGESSGCIRVVPEIAQLIWDTLSIGDTVTVLT